LDGGRRLRRPPLERSAGAITDRYNMKINDVLIGACLFVLAIYIFVYAQTLPAMHGQPFGAATFPTVIALGLAACSALLAVRAWRGRRHHPDWVEFADWARVPRTRANFFITLGLILLYVVLSDRVGFIPLSIAILVTMFVRQKIPIVRGLVIAVLVTLAIQYAFGSLLRIPLPRGILTEVLW